MISGTGRERMASSSALFETPPIRMSVTLVVTGGGEFVLPLFPPLPALPTGMNGACCCVTEANDLVFPTRLMWAVLAGGDGVLLFVFRMASPGVGSGRGGIGGGPAVVAAGIA